MEADKRIKGATETPPAAAGAPPDTTASDEFDLGNPIELWECVIDETCRQLGWNWCGEPRGETCAEIRAWLPDDQGRYNVAELRVLINAEPYSRQIFTPEILSPDGARTRAELKLFMDTLLVNFAELPGSEPDQSALEQLTPGATETLPAAAGKASEGKASEFVPPPDEFGKKYFPGYNRRMAKQIGDAFPLAWKDHDDNIEVKWNNQAIAKRAPASPTTVCRYLSVFRTYGIEQIHNVELPKSNKARRKQ